MENLLIFFSMFLIPPTLFIMVAWYWSTKQNVCLFDEGGAAVVPLLASVLFPTIAVLIAIKWLSFPVGGFILGYVIFEAVGGWVMFGIFCLCGLTESFQAKIESKTQSELLGIDLNAVGSGKYIALYHENNSRFDTEKNGLHFDLYQTRLKKDNSGEHVVIKKVHTFGQYHKHKLPRSRMIKLLKDYFDNQTIFNVESPALLVEAPKKPAPEVLFLGE